MNTPHPGRPADTAHDHDHDHEPVKICSCTNAQGEVVRRLAATCWHECDRTNWESSEK